MKELQVQNAGLVLLHPFLPALFARTGYMEQGKFKNEAAAVKGVFLLQYIATGQEPTTGSAANEELGLNKVLCGLPLSKQCQPMGVLSEEEKQAGRSLLEAMLKSWAEMSRSSEEILRESFLKRSGRLKDKKGSRLLIVEKNGHTDPLLQRLPWAFNPVRHGWMKEPVQVDW